MLFAEIAATSAAVTATSSRRQKIELIGACLRKAEPDEAEAAVAYLAGVLRQRQIGVGWASLREVPSPAVEATLTVADVDSALAAVGAASGAGSKARRAELLADLFGRATADEQRYLRALLVGEVRQGALAGVAAEAIATAAEVPTADVRRALLLRGDLRAVGAAALTGGAAALAEFRLEVGNALSPMLAQPAADVAEAFAKAGAPAAVEWKLDGIRVQVHKSGPDVSVYTRSLDDVTGRLPEIVEAVTTFPVERVVLDGEAIVLRGDGAPVPFQDTARRTGSRGETGELRERLPVTVFFFDVLHVDGADVLDQPARERWAALERVVPKPYLVPRIITDSADEAAEFFADAVATGHEGVVVKSVEAPYDAGRRGAAWLKVKPRHTLDLVVLAAEWGHGRRRGWLSNLHLGARDPETGGFVMLGKTFKGLTDEMLTWQTERLLELAVDRGDWVVRVRPELVVEIAIDGVQTSTRYPGGMALRFARVLRYREDKPVTEADTVDTVRTIHSGSGRP